MSAIQQFAALDKTPPRQSAHKSKPDPGSESSISHRI